MRWRRARCACCGAANRPRLPPSVAQTVVDFLCTVSLSSGVAPLACSTTPLVGTRSAGRGRKAKTDPLSAGRASPSPSDVAARQVLSWTGTGKPLGQCAFVHSSCVTAMVSSSTRGARPPLEAAATALRALHSALHRRWLRPTTVRACSRGPPQAAAVPQQARTASVLPLAAAPPSPTRARESPPSSLAAAAAQRFRGCAGRAARCEASLHAPPRAPPCSATPRVG